ncbi:MAG: saccharopine dehydrogenase family protein [Giesbergeria sp.]|uniref:saccharopine dehydrogenase family protein n=1 Tax=Giesbergeria sp. TaxID=2818473 RepID=UPI0026193919|nr:saccharopine dehydrogenase family protein [Giesbergeria sp.]MDD2608531.1 saccharopine dehydrogenase family protein [Giesbergeria sp.]
MTVLQIGAGGVGWALAHKLAQNNDLIGDLVIASRTLAKCNTIIDSIRRKGNIKDPMRTISACTLDASDVAATVQLIQAVRPDLVAYVGPPWTSVAVMEACCQAGVSYLDTSVATDLCSPGQQVPVAYDVQWAFRERFAALGITGILSTGFDPGVVSVFCAWAQKHLFDEIDSIDVMDVNAGSHGRKFATNFDPEANLLEVQGDSFYWEGGQWKQVPCHTRMREVEFPVVGTHKVYSMAHDEVRSLVEFFPNSSVEFWMGFGDNYLKYFNVLRDVGMLSPEPITTASGVTVAPLSVLKALLPEPTSLAANYTGKTCIGSMLTGKKSGQRRKVFIYNICDHEQSYQEIESQAISYTTGVPAAVGVLLYFSGQWRQPGLFNVEQLDPDAFLALMPRLGLSWDVQELPA